MRMDRSEWFLAIIAYMLATLVFTLEADEVDIVILPVLAVLVGLPIYVVVYHLNERAQQSNE